MQPQQPKQSWWNSRNGMFTVAGMWVVVTIIWVVVVGMSGAVFDMVAAGVSALATVISIVRAYKTPK